jgi:hypothetical protein
MPMEYLDLPDFQPRPHHGYIEILSAPLTGSRLNQPQYIMGVLDQRGLVVNECVARWVHDTGELGV